MKKNLYRIISFVLVIVWMITIFWLSSMNADESNKKSKKAIDKALPISAEVQENPKEKTDENTENGNRGAQVQNKNEVQVITLEQEEISKELPKISQENAAVAEIQVKEQKEISKVVQEEEKETLLLSTNNSSTKITPEKKKQMVDELNKPLRKVMHASVYFVLAMLLFNFILSLELKKAYLKFILPIVIVFLYACSDEYHQTFVAGRSGEWRDVLKKLEGYKSFNAI